jgi:hypothetical protein
MPDTLQKLQPDRDLQCYFYEPSAVAALSGTSAAGFTVSGTWRQQFDWAVIEWNRDNVFEHPAFRYLPDGDLSGLTLSYQETRQNCIPLDSSLFPTVDWPFLRVWATTSGVEQVYEVPLTSYSTAAAGSYTPATVEFTLSGSVTAGDYVGLAFLSEHYPYLMNAGDTLETAIDNIYQGINAFSATMSATWPGTGTTITITYLGTGLPAANLSTTGANGNLIGAYSYVSGSQTEQWDAVSKQFSGGISPSQWQVTLPFASLMGTVVGSTDTTPVAVPATAIRKLRWTYAADLQAGAFVRSEFQVTVTNWTVTGSGRGYSIAGPGSQRIEDDSSQVQYTGTWASAGGNFSGGTIHSTSVPSSSVSCTYTSSQDHSLYLGTRLLATGTVISIVVDAQSAASLNLNIPGEDVLIRSLLGQLGSGSHTVTVTHDGASGTDFYFDFFEIAIVTTTLPIETTETKLTLATDWDTEHSLALAPERTAWMIYSLGFQARVNYYVGALWFYELLCAGQQYASATITFSGSPDPNLITQIILGTYGLSSSFDTTIEHLNLIGDTTETLATAFAQLLNGGYTAVWAQANGSQLTIYSRAMGSAGGSITIATSANTTDLTIAVSGTNSIAATGSIPAATTFGGGVDGNWYTDLEAMPRLNRAVRDWSQSFFEALNGYGFDATASFSMELGNGDPSTAAGIAQRYPSQDAVLLSTPSLQTNFSPTSAAYWQQVHLDMANVMNAAGLTPYLQFGEVQWWYFPELSGTPPGMPFYDAYTTSTFQTQYGRAMTVISSNTADPSTVPQEAAFLPGLIGAFTAQIRAFVRGTYPSCRFEVLYPPDVNNFALTRVINYPTSDWTPANLTCLKTESFTYTYERNLDLSLVSMNTVNSLGFTPAQRAHLVGVSDSSTAWLKEVRMAQGQGFESVVLFALDQMCLIGYSLPLSTGLHRSTRLG